MTDPVLSYVQSGMKTGATGYRVGYTLDLQDASLWFLLVHSPVIARIFKNNLVFATLRTVLRDTASFRTGHRLHWSSKWNLKEFGDANVWLEEDNYSEFDKVLSGFNEDRDFVADLFVKLKSRGRAGIGTKLSAGNDFYAMLADRHTILNQRKGIEEIVHLSWPLFLCLYPLQPIERRTAKLAQKMTSRGIEKRCEFFLIQLPPSTTIDPLCRGMIQGAHIVPDALGGADNPENGLWLCQFHHQVTEGKLRGRRDGDSVRVRFVGQDTRASSERSAAIIS